MSKNLSARISKEMMDKDKFSQWLGIQKILVKTGHCILKMKVREEMLNCFHIAHGGICFSLADTALAYASNSHGRLCVALECSISFPVAVHAGDKLTCETKELSLTNKTGTYLIEITNQKNQKVAFFKGIVYRTSKEWFDGADNESLRIYGKKNGADNESLRIYEKKNGADNESLRIYGKKNGADNESLQVYGKKEKLIYPELSYKIIGCAFDVFNEIGGGHKESVYQKAMKQIFEKRNISAEENVYYPVTFEKKTIGKNYLDFLVEKKIITELKSLSRFSKAHFDQVLNYLKVSNLNLAILLNFTSSEVQIKRVVNFELVNESDL